MYSDEEKAIILATQAHKLGIASIIALLFLLWPVSLICCTDGYYKAKKANALAPDNIIVQSGYKIINISRWALIIFLTVVPLVVGVIVSFF